MILSFIEQSALSNAYNFSLPSCPAIFSGGSQRELGRRRHVVPGQQHGHRLVINSFLCPSDTVPPPYTGTPASMARRTPSRCSYLLTAPPSTATCITGTTGLSAENMPPMTLGIFSGNDLSNPMSTIKDGTSNTALSGESPFVKYQHELRGVLGSRVLLLDPRDCPSLPTNTSYATYLPNAPAPAPVAASNPNQLLYQWVMGSKHPGGLNILFADGSVHFIKNSISPATWYALHDEAQQRNHRRQQLLTRRRRPSPDRRFSWRSRRCDTLRCPRPWPWWLGCGDSGPKLVPVSGTVLLNGEPLEGATVVFTPARTPPAGRGSS